MILMLSLKKLGKDTFKLRPDNRFIAFWSTIEKYNNCTRIFKIIWFAIFSTYMPIAHALYCVIEDRHVDLCLRRGVVTDFCERRRWGGEGLKEERGERGGRVTWEEGGCTKLEAATLPALTWDGTFKHGFPKRLLLFLHLSFKRPSSPVIASISASKVFQPTCRGDPWQRLVSISCWAGATFKERPLLRLPLPLLLLPGDSLSKN